MRGKGLRDGQTACYLDSGRGLAYVDYSKGYSIYDITENEDGTFRAFLVFGVRSFLEEDVYKRQVSTINQDYRP